MTERATSTYDLSLLERSAERWRASAALRSYYTDLLGAVLRRAPLTPRLELGSGIGAIREVAPDVETSDVAPTRYVDRVVSAYEIEKTGRLWGAIVAVDVLHHLCEPMRFFASAARSLRPGGRLVLAEPAATRFGRGFYRVFHHEPCEPGTLRAPWVFGAEAESGEFANMGMAWALFVRDRASVAARLAEHGLAIAEVSFRDGLAYPATGGLSKPSLLPAWAIRGLLRVEQGLPQWFWRGAGLRMIVVLEKTEATQPMPNARLFSS